MNYNDVILLKQNSGYSTDVIYADGHSEHFKVSAKWILHTWCVHNGSTLEGRQRAVRLKFGFRQKTPVMITERSRSVFFPIYGVSVKENVWLNVSYIQDVKQKGKETIVYLTNNTTQVFPLDHRVIQMQVARSGIVWSEIHNTEWMKDESFKLINY